MEPEIKTVDTLRHDPIASLKHEGVERMKAALLSSALDDPYSVNAALRHVTILRVHHQITRIVQYLDIMDKLEDKLYDAISYELDTCLSGDFSTITRLLAIQEKLQKSIIESNKLLAPYIDMDQYPAFTDIAEPVIEDSKVLNFPAAQRDAIRENAGAILAELAEM